MIPKYFVVKRDDSPEWKEFIKWFNQRYDQDWWCVTYPYYGYDGNEEYNGTNGWHKPSDFINNPVVFESAKDFMKLVDFPEKWCIKCNAQEVVDYCNKYGKFTHYRICDSFAHFPSPNGHWTTFGSIQPGYTEITLEQFKEHILKQKMITITKAQLKEIHDIACSSWKTKIKNYAKRDVFSDNVELSVSEVDAMFNAATVDQKPVLNKIFGRTEFTVGDLKHGEIGEDENCFYIRLGDYVVTLNAGDNALKKEDRVDILKFISNIKCAKLAPGDIIEIGPTVYDA